MSTSEQKEIKYRFNEGQMCTHCIRRDCICEERQSDGSWIAKAEQKDWQTEFDWRTKVPKELHNLGAKHWVALCLFAEDILSSQAHALKEQMKACVPEEKEDQGTYCGCDGECFGACNKSFNECRNQTLSAIESIKI